MGGVSFAMIGAGYGLALQMFSNAARKLPMLRRPWEHVLVMGVGSVFFVALAEKTAREEIIYAENLETMKRLNKTGMPFPGGGKGQ
mmetsp:Transcript_63261/g.150861  ORF Transcript_63261/g.150861 Transcript_63261/m.150861 type:complete len:86 (-) Transcript_63261:64-321(-)